MSNQRDDREDDVRESTEGMVPDPSVLDSDGEDSEKPEPKKRNPVVLIALLIGMLGIWGSAIGAYVYFKNKPAPKRESTVTQQITPSSNPIGSDYFNQASSGTTSSRSPEPVATGKTSANPVEAGLESFPVNPAIPPAPLDAPTLTPPPVLPAGGNGFNSGFQDTANIEQSLRKSSFVAINAPGKGTPPSVKLAVQPGTEVSATIRQKIFPAVGSWVIAELSQPAGNLPAGTKVVGQVYQSDQNRAYVSFSRAVVSGGMVEIAAVVRDGKDGADGLPLKAPREVMKGVMRGFRAASGLVPFGAQIGQAVTALQQSESSYGFGYANGAQPVRNWNSGKVKLIFLEEQPAKQNRDFDLDFLNQPNFGTQNPFGQPVFPQGYGQGNPILANQPYGAQPGVWGTQPGNPSPVPAGTYPVFPNQPPPQFPTQQQGGR